MCNYCESISRSCFQQFLFWHRIMLVIGLNSPGFTSFMMQRNSYQQFLPIEHSSVITFYKQLLPSTFLEFLQTFSHTDAHRGYSNCCTSSDLRTTGWGDRGIWVCNVLFDSPLDWYKAWITHGSAWLCSKFHKQFAKLFSSGNTSTRILLHKQKGLVIKRYS